MGDICSDFYGGDSPEETKQKGASTNGFDNLVVHVSRLTHNEQKDLAESIIMRLYESGWRVPFISDDGSFNMKKQETL